MRRMPTDLFEYHKEIMAGNADPALPKRRRIDGATNGGPIVTNTPKAIWWLFSRHKGLKGESRPAGSFKNFNVINPEIYWQPWNRPSQGLSIDRCIEDLIIASGMIENISDKEIFRPKRGADRNTKYKKNKLTSAGSLAEVADANGDFDRWDCPYAFVRWRLAEAVGLAYDDDKIDDDLRNSSEIFRSAIKDIESARSKITVAIEKITTLGHIHGSDMYARNAIDRNRNEEANSIKETLSIIDDHLSDLNLLRDKFPGGGRPAVWWRSFVKNCGVIWATLTGKAPTVKNQGFIDFVNAANESLGGKRGQLDSQINTAIKYFEKANPWDRLDAEIKGILAPGHSPMQYIGLDHPRNPNNIWRTSLLNKIEKLKNGDLSAKSDIAFTYMRANEKRKALIVEILDEHGVLAQFRRGTRINH